MLKYTYRFRTEGNGSTCYLDMKVNRQMSGFPLYREGSMRDRGTPGQIELLDAIAKVPGKLRI